MLYLTTGAIEHCAKDKERVALLCPGIWIHYVLDGQGSFNGELLGKGEGFITYKNCYCEYFPNANDPWTYAWIRLEGEDSDGLTHAYGFPETTAVFRFDYGEKLRTLLPAILPISSSPYGIAAAKLILSLHCTPKQENDGETSRNLWLDRAKRYIAENYHRELKIERLANELHIDRKYLRNLFKKHTGKSTFEYLTDYRLQRAKELLTATDAPVGTIAVSVGYPDQLAFSRLFKTHIGMSPSAYRDKHR